MTERHLLSIELPDGKTAQLVEKEGGAPEVYVDGVWGVLYSRGVCKMNFYTAGMSPDQKSEIRDIAVRLVMSLPALIDLSAFLVRQINSLAQDGILINEEAPAIPATPETKPRSKSRRKKPK